MPDGEAPEAIRQEWVGLTIPLAPGQTGPGWAAAAGVLAPTRTWVGRLWSMLSGQARPRRYYIVLVDDALAVLERSSPEAAAWWRVNTPHLLGRAFGFRVEECEVVPDPPDTTIRSGGA